VIVRDTSVAVSMARSAMRGCGVGWIVSLFTCRCSLIDALEDLGPLAGLSAATQGMKRDEAATFGYPGVRSF
jgi:hypothetical protein